MQNGLTYGCTKQQMLKYKEQEIFSASPERLILYLYDHIIRCCSLQDDLGATRAIAELIDGLNFEYKEISKGLLRLYDYCLTRIRAGQFDEPKMIIKELRKNWEISLNNMHQAAVQGV